MYRRLISLTLSCAFAALSMQAQRAALTETTEPAQPVAQSSTPASAPALASAPAAEVKKEDWTVLPLEKSGLAISSMKRMSLGKYEFSEYTRELMRVEWRPGDPIDLYVIKPHGVEKPPVVLYLYDYRWDTDRFRDDRWCKQAVQGGVAAVGFVSALSGQRFHAPRPMKQWFVSQLQEALGTSTHDVQMILNYLSSRGDLDTTHVGMFGEGTGGAIAILAASVDSRIVTLDLLNPWGDWPDWLKESKQIPEEERATYLKPEFLERVSMLDPLTYLPRLKDRSLRILQVADDTVTPPSARDKIAAAVSSPEQLVRYSDSTAFIKAARGGSLSSWLPEHLRPSTQAVSKLQQ
jgi:hypothetical protein